MPDTPTQHPASTSDARKRAAENAAGPKWSDLFGVDPDYTGDLSTDEFIARNRGENLAAPDWGTDDLTHLGRQVVLVSNGDGFTTEIRGVKIAKCDDRGCTEADIRAEKAERAFRELRSESRILPCDGACTDAPEEDCSRHGREPVDLWRIVDEARAERDAARETMARVEALADEWERNYASMLIAGFSGASVGADTAAKRIRAALAQPATDEATAKQGFVVRADEPRCWRSECRNGCGYPGACSEKPATDEGAASGACEVHVPGRDAPSPWCAACQTHRAQPATDEGWLTRESKRARERAASVPPHARPTTLQPATDEEVGA